MTLAFNRAGLGTWMPAEHLVKSIDRKKIRIFSPDNEQRNITQSVELRPENRKRLFEIESFEGLHQIAVVSRCNAADAVGKGHFCVGFPIRLA